MRFGSLQRRTRARQPRRSSLCAHLCRWVQTCVVQTHPRLRIENQNQTRRRTPQIFHDGAFKKLCGIMNRVHQVRRTDWDLRVLAVRWAYRAISKNQSAEMTPKLTRRDETKRAEKNPHSIAPLVGTGRKDLGKGIMQLQEAIR